MKEMKEQDRRLKEMEIEEWQQRRLHRSPKPQKKRKTSSQKGEDSQENEDEDSQEGDQKINTGTTATTKKVVIAAVSPNATAKNDARESERKESPKGRPKRIVSAKKAPEAPFIKAERVVKKRNLYETMRVSREVKNLGNESDNNDNKNNYNTLSEYFKNREHILASGENNDNIRIVTKRQV